MPVKKTDVPEPTIELNEKDTITRGILVGLTDQNFRVGLLNNGEVAVNMAGSDYTIKVTRKKERVM